VNAREAARGVAVRLAAAGVPDAAFEAELLARWASGLSRTSYFSGAQPAEGAAERLEAMVARRASREPAAYISGEREFAGMPFEVGPSVLVPRPETEMLVDLGAAEYRGGDVIIDAGTGTGCIAVATERRLAAAGHRATVLAIDISADALAVARRNARRNGARIVFLQGDLVTGIRRADIALANLPYIPSAEIDALEPEVSQWEPRIALDGGEDGFALIGRLIQDCAERLRPRLLALEVGFGQADAVEALARAAGAQTTVLPDLSGIDRVVCCRWV
jgi:release factor glutamine methyltransferase